MSARPYAGSLTFFLATTLPPLPASRTVTSTLPGATPPFENTGTCSLDFLPTLMPVVPSARFERPVMKPGETSFALDRLSTSRVTESVPPASFVMSMPLPSPETLVNAQPVGALDQFDQVSAEP